jgi:hypothetical protein
MREPAAREAQTRDAPPRDHPDAVGDAARRLDRALTRLERLVGERPAAGDLFDHDRADLAAELDAARAREHALEEAAAAASMALGRAAAEVRLALGEPLEAETDDESEDYAEEDLDELSAEPDIEPAQEGEAGAEPTDAAEGETPPPAKEPAS